MKYLDLPIFKQSKFHPHSVVFDDGCFGIRKYTIKRIAFVTENLLIAEAHNPYIDRRLSVRDDVYGWDTHNYDSHIHGNLEFTDDIAMGILAWAEYEYGKDEGWEILEAVTPNKFVVTKHITDNPKFMISHKHLKAYDPITFKKTYKDIKLYSPSYSQKRIRHKTLKDATKTLNIWKQQEAERKNIEIKEKDMGINCLPYK